MLSMPILTALIERDQHAHTIKNKLGENYLHFACRAGNLPLVQLLLYHNFPMHEQDTFGRTPLYYALRGEYDAYQSGAPRGSAISLLLLEKGHNLSYCDPACTPLMHASQFGLYAVVEKLLQRGAQVNSIDTRTQCTALTLAAKQNKLAITRLLIRYGAHTDVGSTPDTPFERAAEWRDKGLPELFEVMQRTQPEMKLILKENPITFLARRELGLTRRRNRLR